MKRSMVNLLTLSLLVLGISGCSRSSAVEQTQTGTVEQTETVKQAETVEPAEPESSTPEQTDTSMNSDDTLEQTLYRVMSRILTDQGLDHAIDYDNGLEDISKDAIVKLCTSESGQYEAYGFISSEYGKTGILLNNILDWGENWNYLEEPWSYGAAKPTLEEPAEYEVLFSFTQKNDGKEVVRQIYFDTYDTGTMSMRESVSY